MDEKSTISDYNINPQEILNLFKMDGKSTIRKEIITLYTISDIIVFIIVLLTLISCLHFLVCLLSKWDCRHTFKNGMFISAMTVVCMVSVKKVVAIVSWFNNPSLYSEYNEPCLFSFLDIRIEILEGLLFCLISTVLFINLCMPVCSGRIILW